jgi:hypothetical protein
MLNDGKRITGYEPLQTTKCSEQSTWRKTLFRWKFVSAYILSMDRVYDLYVQCPVHRTGIYNCGLPIYQGKKTIYFIPYAKTDGHVQTNGA